MGQVIAVPTFPSKILGDYFRRRFVPQSLMGPWAENVIDAEASILGSGNGSGFRHERDRRRLDDFE